MLKKILITIFILGISGFLAVNAKKFLDKKTQEVEKEPKPKATPISVEIVRAKEGNISKNIMLLSQIKSIREISLSTKLMVYQRYFCFRDDSHVIRANSLLEIDSNELKNSLKSLEAMLKARESSLKIARKISRERNRRLYSVGGVSKEMLENSFGKLQNRKSSSIIS